MENARCEVARGDLLTYFAEVKMGLAQMQTAAQLLNMDETRFCSPPEKAKKQKVVSRTDCPVKLAFREQSDLNHITLVAMIAFSRETLKLMFLTDSRRVSLIPTWQSLPPTLSFAGLERAMGSMSRWLSIGRTLWAQIVSASAIK
jgi:hypothetical protein